MKAANMSCKENVLRTAWLGLSKSNSSLSTAPELLTGDVLDKQGSNYNMKHPDHWLRGAEGVVSQGGVWKAEG